MIHANMHGECSSAKGGMVWPALRLMFALAILTALLMAFPARGAYAYTTDESTYDNLSSLGYGNVYLNSLYQLRNADFESSLDADGNPVFKRETVVTADNHSGLLAVTLDTTAGGDFPALDQSAISDNSSRVSVSLSDELGKDVWYRLSWKEAGTVTAGEGAGRKVDLTVTVSDICITPMKTGYGEPQVALLWHEGSKSVGSYIAAKTSAAVNPETGEPLQIWQGLINASQHVKIELTYSDDGTPCGSRIQYSFKDIDNRGTEDYQFSEAVRLEEGFEDKVYVESDHCIEVTEAGEYSTYSAGVMYDSQGAPVAANDDGRKNNPRDSVVAYSSSSSGSVELTWLGFKCSTSLVAEPYGTPPMYELTVDPNGGAFATDEEGSYAEDADGDDSFTYSEKLIPGYSYLSDLGNAKATRVGYSLVGYVLNDEDFEAGRYAKGKDNEGKASSPIIYEADGTLPADDGNATSDNPDTGDGYWWINKTYQVGSDLTVVAQWDPLDYYIVFDKNAEDATGSMPNQDMEYDMPEALDANEFSREGWVWKGWDTTPSGDGTRYEDREEVLNLVNLNDEGGVDYGPDGETLVNPVVLYAQWEKAPAGDLSISKVVTGGTDATAAREFHFEIAMQTQEGNSLAKSYVLAIKGSDGESTSSSIAPELNEDGSSTGVYSVILRDGETAVIEGLPQGTRYEVMEVNIPVGFELEGQEVQSGVISSGGQAAEASFVNAYSSVGHAVIRGTKALADGSLPTSGEFTFILEDGAGNTLQTASNVNGEFEFGPIEYTNADAGKTFVYKVREQAAENSAYIFDESVVDVSVTPVDNGDGTITANPVYGNGAESAGFVNCVTTELTITKIWDDQNDFDKVRPEKITVVLYANDVEYGTFEMTADDAADDANVWEKTIGGLATTDVQGNAIEYTIGEALDDDLEDYDSTVEGYTITNSHEVSYSLPLAGGAGVLPYVGLGSAAVLAALALGIRRRDDGATKVPTFRTK